LFGNGRVAKSDESIPNGNLAEWNKSAVPVADLLPEMAKQPSSVIGRRYNRAKKQHGGDRKSSAQNAHLKTAQSLARQIGRRIGP
jgi:hypothetical protein